MRRLGQLRADKVCPTRWESPRSKDFPKRGGLYAEVASRRTQIKVVKQIKKQAVRDCWIACFLRFMIKRFVREIGRN